MKSTGSKVPVRLDQAQLRPCWTSTSHLELNPSWGEIPGLHSFPAHSHLPPGQAGSAMALQPFIALLQVAHAQPCSSSPGSAHAGGISWIKNVLITSRLIKMI